MQILRRHTALVALVAAGLLWGLTVPLSKLVLEWLDGGSLTVIRFALAAPVLAILARKHLRAAFTPRILAAGAIGYGVVVTLQNAGIEHTSVSHASLIVGATPALVALTAAASGRGSSSRVAWLGFALALAGVGIVAGGGGGAAGLGGDALVLLSVALSATFVVIQPSLLRGRNPFAVTAVQMIGGAAGRAPQRDLRGHPARARELDPGHRAARARVHRDRRPVRAVRLRPVARRARARRRVPEPGAAGRHGRGCLRLRRSVRPDAAARRFRDPRRHRAQHDSAQQAEPLGAESHTRRRGAASSRRPGPSGKLRIKQRPFSLSPNMTLLAPRPDRILTPHTFVVPVVRELPSPLTPSPLPGSPPRPGSELSLLLPDPPLHWPPGFLLPLAASSA